MTRTTLSFLLLPAVALIASAGYCLYVLAAPSPSDSSPLTLPAQPKIGPTRAVAFPEEPAWRSSAAEAGAAPADSAPASGHGQTSARPATPLPAGASGAATSAPRTLPLPIVFQDFDHEAAGLTAIQVQMLNSLREDFVREVGGLQQDPNDPGYAERWRQLQPDYDHRLRALFGATFVDQLARLTTQAPTQKK